MAKIDICSVGWRVLGFGAALSLGACVTQPPLNAERADEAAASAPAVASYASVDGLVPTGTTRVRTRATSYPDGVQWLRIVRRDHTGGAIAAQVALSVGVSAIAGRPGAAVQGFSKDDLTGDVVSELIGQPWASNPGLKELPEALSEIATRVYAARVWKELERSRSESGWSREEAVAAARLPAEADVPVNPGYWRLVYENLSGNDELYRLQFRPAADERHGSALVVRHVCRRQRNDIAESMPEWLLPRRRSVWSHNPRAKEICG